jgi:hypothetical protein
VSVYATIGLRFDYVGRLQVGIIELCNMGLAYKDDR